MAMGVSKSGKALVCWSSPFIRSWNYSFNKYFLTVLSPASHWAEHKENELRKHGASFQGTDSLGEDVCTHVHVTVPCDECFTRTKWHGNRAAVPGDSGKVSSKRRLLSRAFEGNTEALWTVEKVEGRLDVTLFRQTRHFQSHSMVFASNLQRLWNYELYCPFFSSGTVSVLWSTLHVALAAIHKDEGYQAAQRAQAVGPGTRSSLPRLTEANADTFQEKRRGLCL